MISNELETTTTNKQNGERERERERERVREREREREVRLRKIYSFRPLPFVNGCKWMTYHLTRSDPEAFWLRPVMAVTASYGHYGQRAARIGPNSVCRIRLPASV